MTARIRAAVVRIVDRGDTTTVLGPKGARRFDGDSAELVRAVLQIHARPTTRVELLAALAALAEGDVPEEPIDQVVAMLVEDGVLVAPKAAQSAPWPRRVVLGVTGAVASADAPLYVRALQSVGAEVRVAMSRTAKAFASPLALEALTHWPVATRLVARNPEDPVPHISLAEWAEVVVVCPCSATTLARLATGDCSDLVAAIACATRAPVVVVPSMNDGMYASPAVHANLATLRAHGRWVVHPALGVEVAHAPGLRRDMFGPAPPPSAVADVVKHVMSTLPPFTPSTPPEWERVWASNLRLPWTVDAVEPELAAAIDALPAGRLLEIGCGSGVVAMHAAKRGWRVTATEISPTALARARARLDAPVLLVLDDITRSSLEGPFDAAVDRGLLHCLTDEAQRAYAANVERLVRGPLVIVAHAPGGERGTRAMSAADLAALFPARTVTKSTPTTLSGGIANVFVLDILRAT